MIGQIFLQAKNAINTPATLAKIIVMIDRETWSGLDTDLKGDLYYESFEGLSLGVPLGLRVRDKLHPSQVCAGLSALRGCQ